MSDTNPLSARSRGLRRRLTVLLVLTLLITGGGLAGYFIWRPRPASIPEISTAGLDKELTAAIAEARAAVQDRPESAGAWGFLGMVLFAHDLYPECLPILAKAQELDPEDVRWPYLRGLALVLERPEEGLASLKRAVQLKPNDFSLRLRLAEELLKQGNLSEAEVIFDQLVAERADDPRALLGQGMIFTQTERAEEAIPLLRKAANHQTAGHTASMALAQALFFLGKDSEAEKVRQTAIEIGVDQKWPDPILQQVLALQTGLEPGINQVIAMLSQGLLTKAEPLVNELIRKYPKSAKAYLSRGQIRFKKGDLANAEIDLRVASRLDKDLVKAVFLLAGTQMLQKKYDIAARNYLKTISLKPAYGLAYYNLGECRLKLNDKRGGLEGFRNAVRYRPDLADAHLKLGGLLLQEGQTKEAIVYLNNAIRLDSGNVAARQLLKTAESKKKS